MLSQRFLHLIFLFSISALIIPQAFSSLSHRRIQRDAESHSINRTRRHRRRDGLGIGNIINSILSGGDFSITFGQTNPNGCSGKQMTYTNGQGAFDKETLAERFDLFHNTWGSSAASSASTQTTECHEFDPQTGITSWSTAYDWKVDSDSQKNQVKSYCNAGWAGKPVQISSLNEFKTIWSWSYEGASSDLIADVSYDIFTSKSEGCSGQSGGCASHEIMIWLSARGGALPAGSKVSQNPVTIEGGYAFDVYKGVVGGIPVISLVPSPANQEYTKFSADLIPLMEKLSEYGLESDEYISTCGAGTEPFRGQAKLHTQSYTLRLS